MQTIKISDKAYKIIMRHVNQMGNETIEQAVDELTENAFGTVWVDMRPKYQK
jgi:hypothetical protein